MRVVEFVKAFYLGGTEVQVVELLRGLLGRCDVDVAVLDAVGPLLESVWRLGVLPREFPLKGSYLSVNTPWQIARLANWLRARKVELVHAHDFYATLLAVPASHLAGVKVVVGRLDLLHWHGRARAAALKHLTRLADHVVVNAEAVRRLVLSEGVDPDRVTLIRNGLDLKAFDARAHGPLDAPLPDVGGAPTVVHVANLAHPVKRQEDLLEALRLLRRDVGPVHAFFVGDGPRRAELESLASRLGVADVAHFLGFRRDAPAIQARADVGVLCSSGEGLSNAVIEGMAARLPMVVTDVGGNPELIAHGERGLLVEPERPDRLAAAIAQLIADRAAARQMGERARLFIERELTLEKLIAGHEALYRKVLGRGDRSRGAAAA